jgi:hypothetical protein
MGRYANNHAFLALISTYHCEKWHKLYKKSQIEHNIGTYFFLRTAVLEKLVYILVTMNETSILHLAGGKVTLQARRAVNQSKKPANEKFVYRDNLDFLIIMRLLRFCMELLIRIQNCNAR